MECRYKEYGIQSRFKMADKSLRQAMGYALDNDAVGERSMQV